METLFNDLRYAIKMLFKSKGLTVVAVVSLAVGIGANTVIFSVVNSLLLRPRAVSKPEQLVELYTGDLQHPYETTSYPSYLDLRDRNDVFSGLAAYGISQFKLGGMNQVEQIWGETVSGNYFDVLGLQAYKGRTFASEENLVPGRNPVMVISYGLWQRKFNSDPALIGKTVRVNNQELTVIGIAPPQYTGMLRGLASEVWIPVMMMPLLEPKSGPAMVSSRGSRWLLAVGRLKPDTTLAQARARFDLLSREMQATHPEEWRSKQTESGVVRELFVTVLAESETRVHPDMQSSIYALAGLLVVIVNLVLVIACMNLASMLLTRALARRKEVAVRLALGASRWRIIRQLLTESVLLSLIAGAAGLVFAVWLLDLALAFIPALPQGIRIALDLRLDWHVPVYAIAFSTLTGVLFGLAPALHSSKADVSTVLKEDSSGFSGRYRKSRLRMSLVVAQVAFSLLLLIAAGLVLRSLEKVRPTRLGFASDNILVAPVALDEVQYDDRGKSQEFYRQLSERISSLPGVQAVSLVDGVPGGFMGRTRRSTEIEGYQAGAGEDMQIDFAIVGPRYFTNMKVPFVQGRDFDDRDRDGSPCVAIVNEPFAKRYFSGTGSPLGKHLANLASQSKQMCEIVGVIHDDQWQSLEKAPRPFFFFALQQSDRRRMTLLVSSAGDPASLIPPVRRTIQGLEPNIPVTDVQTLREYFSALLYPFRLLGIVMAACGVMALLLATLGIYGVVSYSVAQREREVGIRIALGALHRDILRMVVGQGMILVGYGLAAGLLLGLALTRVLTSSLFESELLFGVSATDSLTFAGVTALLAFVALVACYVPARRATKVNLLSALRYE
jgi:macrolide transport system ATP-binding/permease protein